MTQTQSRPTPKAAGAKPRKAPPPAPADGAPTYTHDAGRTRVWVGDCRQQLPKVPEVAAGTVDLVFADPPFNWNRAYDQWHDAMPEQEYVDFTFDWIDICVRALRPGGSLWINIPDTWAAEIVCYLKGRLNRKPPTPMNFQNWCIWHYRFGQNATERFINSKVHALYFIKPGARHTWNGEAVAELSDRAAIYADPRTLTKKDGMPPRMRVPLDVWYGQYWGRIQGNNKERRSYHDNQLPEVYLERVIRACSNPGNLVLDPFLGSGTTGVVARALNRRFVGTEFSAENARLAWERVTVLGPYRKMAVDKAEVTHSAIFEKRSKRPLPQAEAQPKPRAPRTRRAKP
ncbi:MAG: DNA methyltransferase [Phycisphaerales bacterium]